MKHTTRPSTILAGLVAASLLAGCAQTPLLGGAASKTAPAAQPGAAATAQHPHAEPAAPPPPADPAQAALREGIDAYFNGDYNGAIKKLGAPEIVKGPKAVQLSAIKYTAFSYCVSGRARQCRQQFDKALKLDPTFDLEPGEHGHPLWGPVFAKAKKGK